MFDASSRILSKIRTSANTFCKAAVAVSALILQGCASVGDIMPPALNLPNRPTDVTVVEHGSTIVIGFQIPKTTTEGQLIRKPPKIEVRIGPMPQNPADLNGFFGLSKGVPATGPHVETPAAPWVNQRIGITIRLMNNREKDAGWTPLVPLTVIPPLDTPKDLAAAAQPTGVSLHWTSSAQQFRVFRRDPDSTGFSQVATPNAASYDDTVEFGKDYSYYVQAIAPAGEGTAESEDSAAVSIKPIDTFPPAVPTGLSYILGARTIEFSWTRNTEPDLAGYRVYRAFENNSFERVTDTRDTTSYSDRNIEAGKHYRYAVTAIDRAGNESKMSEPLVVTAP